MGILVRAIGATAAVWFGLLMLPYVGSAMAADSIPAPLNQSPQTPVANAPLAFKQQPIPQIPHERNPTSWPQPDYFSETLKLTGLDAEERYKSLHIRSGQISDATQYVVLPVQTQAFAFGRTFRAIVGAELDRQLGSNGISASRQTDVLDAYGPFSRRLDDATLKAFSVEHPKQKLIGFYVGHDGVTHAFLDLTVRNGALQASAHKTIDLPEDAMQAIDAISKAIPDLLKQAGLSRAETKPASGSDGFTCTEAAWNLDDLPQSATGQQLACRALVVGTLLSNFEADAVRLGRMQSPAKLAWLAQAYVIANQSASKSDTAKAIRNLSLAQLEIGAPDTPPVGYATATDPVVSRVGKLLSIWARAGQSPARSERDLVDKFLAEATDGLPEFPRAVAAERTNFWETFRRVDFCAIEGAFPGPVMRSKCEANEAHSKQPSTRPATHAELLLYQDWRVAKGYKDLVHYGLTLGRPDRVRETDRTMPADVASHPFVERIRYRLTIESPPRGGETFDDVVARSRGEVERFVQSTINLQANDRWLAGYSISEHSWTKNTHIANDEQIVRYSSAERRLLSVLRFDRFVPDRIVFAEKRVVGAPAYFLAPSPVYGMPVVTRPIVTAQPPASGVQVSRGNASHPYKPMLFTPHFDGLDQPSVENLQSELHSHPNDMESRGRLGIAMLKEGTPVPEVVALFNAHSANQRDGESVGESHIWALPAHVFYLSGEVQAARPFYEKVRAIGSGSDSDMLADVRVNLIDGNIAEALKSTKARVDRYGSDYARRDLMGLQFMTKQPASAWDVFRSHAVTAEDLEFWYGPSVGHRMQGLDLRGIKTWLVASKLDRVQIDYIDVAYLYLHMMAVMDRVPSDSDIKLLRELVGDHGSEDRRWAISAILVQSALADHDPKQTYARVVEETTNGIFPGGNEFMLPFYVWTAAQANRQDAYLVDVGKATVRSDFNHTLAKAMLLAIDGKTSESLKFFKASRYEMANLTWGRDRGLIGYRLPVQYQYALAGYLMYRKTGEVAYRDNVLRFLDGVEKSNPYFGWTYNLEALLETNKKKQTLAACRGHFLDPQSYFLTQLKGSKPRACPAVLW